MRNPLNPHNRNPLELRNDVGQPLEPEGQRNRYDLQRNLFHENQRQADHADPNPTAAENHQNNPGQNGTGQGNFQKFINDLIKDALIPPELSLWLWASGRKITTDEALMLHMAYQDGINQEYRQQRPNNDSLMMLFQDLLQDDKTDKEVIVKEVNNPEDDLGYYSDSLGYGPDYSSDYGSDDEH